MFVLLQIDTEICFCNVFIVTDGFWGTFLILVLLQFESDVRSWVFELLQTDSEVRFECLHCYRLILMFVFEYIVTDWFWCSFLNVLLQIDFDLRLWMYCYRLILMYVFECLHCYRLILRQVENSKNRRILIFFSILNSIINSKVIIKSMEVSQAWIVIPLWH